MTGNDSMDFGLKNIWNEWFNYRKGKKLSRELCEFWYHLEENLAELHNELNDGTYKHGGYSAFTISDNKKRVISVASIKDRVVHRLIYDYLVRPVAKRTAHTIKLIAKQSPFFDHTFIYDVWSCRKGKGLLGAIERTQEFLHRNKNSFVWRADIKKFFENVDHDVLLRLIGRRVKDLWLIKEVVRSYPQGIPIGNLTSQIFANIYLNELDRFVKHNLKPKAYLRYGDDFILIEKDERKLREFRFRVIEFLKNLNLDLHAKNDVIVKVRHGLKFLGVIIGPDGRRLNRRMKTRINNRLTTKNLSSYWGLVMKHGNRKEREIFNWRIANFSP